jgi:hypothetical protein
VTEYTKLGAAQYFRFNAKMCGFSGAAIILTLSHAILARKRVLIGGNIRLNRRLARINLFQISELKQ